MPAEHDLSTVEWFQWVLRAEAAALQQVADSFEHQAGEIEAACAILMSYSGESEEIVRLGSELKRMGSRLIGITGNGSSRLALLVDVILKMGNIREACQLGLAPSSSTTVMLAIGDALALAVAKSSGFTEWDFAANHPAGMLGLKFRFVHEFMRKPPGLVTVQPGVNMQEVIRRVTSSKMGAAVVTNSKGELLGIFTDGDLRRSLLSGGDVLQQPVENFASMPCAFVHDESSVADALRLMQDKRIEDLPVTSASQGCVVGLLCLKDIK